MLLGYMYISICAQYLVPTMRETKAIKIADLFQGME